MFDAPGRRAAQRGLEGVGWYEAEHDGLDSAVRALGGRQKHDLAAPWFSYGAQYVLAISRFRQKRPFNIQFRQRHRFGLPRGELDVKN